MSKFNVDKSTIAIISYLPNNEKICDSKENINVKVIDENIKENDQPYRKIENIKSQYNVSKNDTPIDAGKIDACHQGTPPNDFNTVRIQNSRLKFEKTDFKHKHSVQVVIRFNINVKVIDESIQENDQLYRKIEKIKGQSTNVSEMILQLMMTKLMHVLP